MPPNPVTFRPAQGSLLEALKDVPNEPEIDVESWNREWVAVEAEMKTIILLNDYLALLKATLINISQETNLV